MKNATRTALQESGFHVCPQGFADIINANAWAAVDQRHDRKNYASAHEVVASYLQNAIDTVKEEPTMRGLSAMMVYGAFCAELANAWAKTVPASEGRIPDGFRL